MAANDNKHITLRTLKYYHEKYVADIAKQITAENSELRNAVETVVDEKLAWNGKLPE